MTMSGKRILGPNIKKLLARVVARKSIPPSGGFVDGIKVLTTPGRLSEITRESIDWIDQQIHAIKMAPDNPDGDDEESIAGAILSNLDERGENDVTK